MLVVYAFECVKNGFAYVGYSADHRRRLQEHRRLLRRGIHSASRMVADWRTYGSTAFHLRVLEVLPEALDPHQAREAETRWQRHFLELGRLYNELKCQMCGQALPFEFARARYLDRVPICGEPPAIGRPGGDRRDGDIGNAEGGQARMKESHGASTAVRALAAHDGRQRKAKRRQNRPYESPHPSSSP